MLWNNKILMRLLLPFCVCWANIAIAGEVCPINKEHPLRFVDVFDGAPEERVSLIPDLAKETYGYWQLGYIYDAGRVVTISCKYANGKKIDVKLIKKIKKCDYKINSQKTLALRCE